MIPIKDITEEHLRGAGEALGLCPYSHAQDSPCWSNVRLVEAKL